MGRPHLHEHAPLSLRALIPLSVTLLLAAPSVADAATDRVRVEPIAVHGELPAHLEAALSTSLEEALERANVDVVDDAAARRVRADVTVKGTDLDVAVELVDAETTEAVARVEGRCDMCGAAEATELIASLGTELSRRIALQQPRATLVVDHATAPVAVAPVQAAPVAPRPKRRALGWAAVGTGALGMTIGAALMAIDGRPIRSKCTGGNVDNDGTCRWNHSSMVPGVVLGTIGVGLLATGVSLIVIEKRRTTRPGLRALLERTPAFARARALARLR